VKRRAFSEPVRITHRSTPGYDLVRDAIYRQNYETEPLASEEAIVVPGSRAVASCLGAKWGLIAAGGPRLWAVIVKGTATSRPNVEYSHKIS